MQTRIPIIVDGARLVGSIPARLVGSIPATAYAVLLDDETPLQAVKRSIERRTRTDCYTSRLDSWTETGSATYQCTFVWPKPIADGGYGVAGELWITISG